MPPRRGAGSAPSSIAQASNRDPSTPQVLQPWGQGVLYQRRDAEGHYQVRWRADDPARYRESDLLVFESARSVTLQRDATHRLADSPIPGVPNPFRTVGSPLYNAMNEVSKRAEDPSNRIEAPASSATPAASSPLEAVNRFAHGFARGLSLDNLEGLARVAPYLPSGNGTVAPFAVTPEAQRGLALTQDVQQLASQRSGDAVAQFNSRISKALGYPPDSPEVRAGRTVAMVAQLAEGAYGLASGAFSLVRSGNAMRLAANNVSVLNALRNPALADLPQVGRFVRELKPEQYAAMPTEVKLAMREGLAGHASQPGVQQALAQLDELDGVSPKVVSLPQGTVAGAIDAIGRSGSSAELAAAVRSVAPGLRGDARIVDAAVGRAEAMNLWFRGTGSHPSNTPAEVFAKGLTSNPQTAFRVQSAMYFSPQQRLAEGYAREHVAQGETGYVYAVQPFADQSGRGPYAFDVQQLPVDLGLYTPSTLPQTSDGVASDILRNVAPEDWQAVLSSRWDVSRITDFHYSNPNSSTETNRLLAVTGGAVYRQPEIRVFSQVFPDEIPFAIEIGPDDQRQLVPNHSKVR